MSLRSQRRRVGVAVSARRSPRATASPACFAPGPRSPRRARPGESYRGPGPAGMPARRRSSPSTARPPEVDRIAQRGLPASGGTAAAPRSATGPAGSPRGPRAHIADASRMNEPTCEPPTGRDPRADARVIRRARDARSRRPIVAPYRLPRARRGRRPRWISCFDAAQLDRAPPPPLARPSGASSAGEANRATRRSSLEPRLARKSGTVERLGRQSTPSAGMSAANAPVVCQMRQRIARAAHLLHRLVELLLHALRRQAPEMRRARVHRATCRRIDREPEPRGEANPAERAQPILAHARVRVARPRARACALEIAPSAERVAQLVERRRVGDGVDREVAPRQILVERGAELHLGVPSVGLHVAPKRRHLVHHAGAVEHADRPELDADRNRAPCPNTRRTSIRRGRRREIPIEMRMAEQRVADGSADAPRLESRGFQALRDVENGRRRVKARHGGGCDAAKSGGE